MNQEFTHCSCAHKYLSTSTWFIKDPPGTTDVWSKLSSSISKPMDGIIGEEVEHVMSQIVSISTKLGTSIDDDNFIEKWTQGLVKLSEGSLRRAKKIHPIYNICTTINYQNRSNTRICDERSRFNLTTLLPHSCLQSKLE